VPGYRTRAAGHLQVTEAIAAGLADAGVASEPAALAHGLPFIPLVAQRSDLVIPAGQARSREVKAMLKVLSSRWLLDRLASLPGYDPGPCGQHVATLLPAAGTGIGALRRSTVAPPAALHGRRDRCRRRTEPAGGTGSDAGGPCGWSPVLWSQVWWATCAAGRPGVDLQ
jgi:hypothetical protein